MASSSFSSSSREREQMSTCSLMIIPGILHPTAFDGVKPSFMKCEWSEEVIAFLAVADYQEFIPLLSAAASSNDVIEKMSCSKRCCRTSWKTSRGKPMIKSKKQIEQISNRKQTEKSQDLTIDSNFYDGNHVLKDGMKQKLSTLFKAQFLWYTRLYTTTRDPNVMVRRIMRTSNSDSGAVTGLDIWRQRTHWFAGSSKTRTVSLLQHIMSSVELTSRSQRTSFSSTIIGWSSPQSMTPSSVKRFYTHTVKVALTFKMSEANQCSFSEHQYQWFHYMVSGALCFR